MVPVRAQIALLLATSLIFVLGCGEGVDVGSYDSTSYEANGLQFSDGEEPDSPGDKYDLIVENPFFAARQNPLSTFSIDVDTASYAKTRTYILDHKQLPPADAVRIEELVNYFNYDYAGPADEHPFAANVEIAACPWKPEHRLVRVGIKGREMQIEDRPLSNLVFLIDVSGSMNNANKLPLLKRGMKLLVDQLGENDRVAMVVYAGNAGLVLPSTSGEHKQAILDALQRLQAGGSTNGGAGIRLAYQIALDNFIPGGTNRVLLCSDGDFNVGTTSDSELIRLVEEKSKQNIFLTVLGFGTGNHNDAMMEQISNRGNGNYAFIDADNEARKVLVEQLSGTLVTIAKDVKIQVEFNPQTVTAYRLIGYENRLMAAEDFSDDTKDAGEIGAGHTVTALYEVVPVGIESDVKVARVDPLRYQEDTLDTEAAESGEILTLKIRYKPPQEDESKQIAYAVTDGGQAFSTASDDFKFASAVASFGMLLRDSKYMGETNYDAVLEIAADGASMDRNGYRAEFISMVELARDLER